MRVVSYLEDIQIKYFKFALLTTFGLVLSACGSTATHSEDVQPQNASIVPFLKMSCFELAKEYENLDQLKPKLIDKVDDEYYSDYWWEYIAWVHPYLQVGFDGNQESVTDLSVIEGQLQIILQVQSYKSCRVPKKQKDPGFGDKVFNWLSGSDVEEKQKQADEVKSKDKFKEDNNISALESEESSIKLTLEVNDHNQKKEKEKEKEKEGLFNWVTDLIENF